MGSDKDMTGRLLTFDGQEAKIISYVRGMQSLSHTCAIRTFKKYSNSDKLSRGEKDLKGNTIMLSDADEKCIQRSNTVASASLIMASSANRNHHICVMNYVMTIK